MHTRRYVERLVDLLDPALNRLHGLDLDEARRRVGSGDPAAVRAIDGSFAIVAKDGITIRMARSLDRPMRYFLAKRQEGPALFVADRIDTLHQALAAEGLGDQFHPSYTRMVPAHHLVEIQLVGCPDPDPTYTRFFTPARAALPTDLDAIGRRYIGAASLEIHKWLRYVERTTPGAPIGVCFSGGIDSGSVFLLVYHAMLQLGLSPSRLKAFVLDAGGPDVAQASDFLKAVGLELFLEAIPGDPAGIDPAETLAVIEDYKALDVECAAVGLQLCRGLRSRYPEWRHLADGDGGDENLKDYPIEENPELTIRSVVDNLMLYQEGWGVGRIKHSLTYSGGLSRSYVRTYAPGAAIRLRGLQPIRAARRSRGGGGHPVRGAHQLRRADALRPEGRHRAPRRPRRDRLRDAGVPQTPFSARRRRGRHAPRLARPARRRSRLSPRLSCPLRRVSAIAAYPAGRAARDRFVLERRGPRPALDPWASPRVVVDPEPDGAGTVVDVATVFLTGRECPWRCVMCDLWRHTIVGDTPVGAIRAAGRGRRVHARRARAPHQAVQRRQLLRSARRAARGRRRQSRAPSRGSIA